MERKNVGPLLDSKAQQRIYGYVLQKREADESAEIPDFTLVRSTLFPEVTEVAGEESETDVHFLAGQLRQSSNVARLETYRMFETVAGESIDKPVVSFVNDEDTQRGPGGLRMKPWGVSEINGTDIHRFTPLGFIQRVQVRWETCNVSCLKLSPGGEKQTVLPLKTPEEKPRVYFESDDKERPQFSPKPFKPSIDVIETAETASSNLFFCPTSHVEPSHSRTALFDSTHPEERTFPYSEAMRELGARWTAQAVNPVKFKNFVVPVLYEAIDTDLAYARYHTLNELYQTKYTEEEILSPTRVKYGDDRHQAKDEAQYRVEEKENSVHHRWISGLRPDGLISMYIAYDPITSEPTSVSKEYMKRSDRLIRLVYDCSTGVSIEEFSPGRKDCLKTHAYTTDDFYCPRQLTFYNGAPLLIRQLSLTVNTLEADFYPQRLDSLLKLTAEYKLYDHTFYKKEVREAIHNYHRRDIIMFVQEYNPGPFNPDPIHRQIESKMFDVVGKTVQIQYFPKKAECAGVAKAIQLTSKTTVGDFIFCPEQQCNCQWHQARIEEKYERTRQMNDGIFFIRKMEDMVCHSAWVVDVRVDSKKPSYACLVLRIIRSRQEARINSILLWKTREQMRGILTNIRQRKEGERKEREYMLHPYYDVFRHYIPFVPPEQITTPPRPFDFKTADEIKALVLQDFRYIQIRRSNKLADQYRKNTKILSRYKRDFKSLLSRMSDVDEVIQISKFVAHLLSTLRLLTTVSRNRLLQHYRTWFIKYDKLKRLLASDIRLSESTQYDKWVTQKLEFERDRRLKLLEEERHCPGSWDTAMDECRPSRFYHRRMTRAELMSKSPAKYDKSESGGTIDSERSASLITIYKKHLNDGDQFNDIDLPESNPVNQSQ